MSIRRYVAVTNREALAQVRRELGEDAVILSNKRVAGGRVEIVAAAPDAMEALVQDARASRSAARAAPPVRALAPMPGESFQQFVRRQSDAAGRSPARTNPTGRAAGPEAPAARATARGAQPARVAAREVPVRQTAAAMYSEVAATLPSEDSPDDRATAPEPTWTPPEPTWTPPAWAAEALAKSAQGSAERSAAAAVARVDDAGRPLARPLQAGGEGAAWAGGVPRPAPEPAVFRRRPSRESTAGAPSRPAASVAAEASASTVPPAGSTPPPLQPAGSTTPPVSTPAAATRPLAAPATAGGAAPMSEAPAPCAGPAAQQAAAPQPAAPVPPPAGEREGGLPATSGAGKDAPADGRLLVELQSLRAALHEQWVTLSSSVAAADAQRRHPLQARLMTRLLTSGFTPEVSRRIALHAPESIDATGLDTWLQDVLTVNLRCASDTDAIVERGGVFALVGPTGVGKTTTVAKLAARFAVRHGTSALGLITLDAYRIAAHEQLRTFGRILGVPVHLAQDAATLRELLASMQGRRLVLIDTCGVGPRDARLAEMLGTLAQADTGARRVQPVLLLHAASHAETLEETARAWRSQEAAGCILTKLDEAARIGGALDCAMRHKLTVLALTNGQRVPEDLHLPNARLLAHLALKPAGPLFALDDHEGAVVAHSATLPRAAAHA